MIVLGISAPPPPPLLVKYWDASCIDMDFLSYCLLSLDICLYSSDSMQLIEYVL